MYNITFNKLNLLTHIIIFLTTTNLCNAQRFEAEDAGLTGDAIIANLATASGGKIVEQREGGLTFDINLEEETFYNIYITAASASGQKINIFSIDGATIDFNISGQEYSTVKLISNLKLTKGQHKVEIIKSWGWINIDYIEFETIEASQRFNINKGLVNPNATDETKRLYQFLYDNYSKKIISGAMTHQGFGEVTWIKGKTGKEPALVGIDFIFNGRGYSWFNEQQPISNAKQYYGRNGIVTFSWHWGDPLHNSNAFYTDETDFDVSKISDVNSDEYAGMINDIDHIAGLLKQLQDANVPILWRPLHEAAGGWFWWGAKGAEPCKQLWLLMYDRMVNYHGLNNLIWVWTHMPGYDEWYPGDEYVDIIGRDIYEQGDHSSQILEFNETSNLFDNKKMVTLSECGSFPDADKLIADKAAWSYFMPWYGDFIREQEHNPVELWVKMLAHDYVITLDEMPNLKNYTTPETKYYTVKFILYGENSQEVNILDSAVVTIGNSSYLTGTTGSFETELKTGVNDIVISKNNYIKNLQVDITSDTTIVDTLRMLPFDITFVVQNNESKALNGCLVTIDETQAYTNESGEACFSGIPPGFTVDFKKGHYNDTTLQNISITSDTTLYIQLEKTTYNITFEVLNQYSNAAIWGAAISAGNKQVTTNNLGKAYMGLTFGEYSLEITDGSYFSHSRKINITSDSLIISYLQPSKANIKFKIKKGTTPVNKAQVYIANQTKETTSLGKATFYDLQTDSSYQYTISKEGYETITGNIFLRIDTTININMVQTTVNNIFQDKTELFRIWPTPASNIINIEILTSYKIEGVEIFNSQGKLIKRIKSDSLPLFKADISGFYDGIYFIRVIVKGGYQIKKFIKIG